MRNPRQPSNVELSSEAAKGVRVPVPRLGVEALDPSYLDYHHVFDLRWHFDVLIRDVKDDVVLSQAYPCHARYVGKLVAMRIPHLSDMVG